MYHVLCFPPRKQDTSVKEGALELFFPHPPIHLNYEFNSGEDDIPGSLGQKPIIL